MDVRQHNQDIAEALAILTPQYPDGSCLVMSITNRDRNSTAGHVCEVSVAQAAKLTVELTHRIATPDEQAAFKARCANEQKRIEAAELKRAGQSLRIIR